MTEKDVLNGKACSMCRREFKKSHSEPVVCTDCWYSIDEDERDGYKQADHPT